MQLTSLDWIIVFLFFAVTLAIGMWASRGSGKSTQDFFLSGRNMPWWLLGVSMVATTFSADTPNLVTDIVRKQGVAGNWAWWAFLLTGMLTVFVYARLWRRSGVMTDLEFYELRYAGGPARFLRQFRAIYLGVFFNVMIMATVCLAGIKIAGVLLDIDPITTVMLVSVVTVIYSASGGLKGVILTDFVQFTFAMVGAIWAAYVVINLPAIGGLDGLFSHPEVTEKLDLIPDFDNPEVYVPLFVVPIAVQWWSVWYPGAEPGGGGYVAQRMLAAKNENHAVGATLLFNAFHYALRPWPWILIALASIVVFPDLDSIAEAFPNVAPSVINDDLAYPAMLSFLPTGLLGLVIASLIAAVMSTLSTHLNWGSSYVVHDWYHRFVNPEASEDRLVLIGRISTVLLMVMAAFLALALSNALQAFAILLQIGAGTGLIFILRWFWWRINAYTEIAGMFISFAVALFLEFAWVPLGLPELAGYTKLLLGIAITTVGWLTVTFATRPTDLATLQHFYTTTRPGGPGWNPVVKSLPAQLDAGADGQLPLRLLAMLVGAITIYSILFASGFYLYGNLSATLIAGVVAAVGIVALLAIWRRLNQPQSRIV
ncbi:SSS family transporter [Lewinella marina]|uniref:Na+:solute symporter n=1 Tax=Neolewinella marina TaxID=438751 RepID=A0A2G0CIM8_9BACT|nr:sodium:solute symporter family protein [Neolewinella marina]NJB85019.1 SSS family transporter [Neolewinella marina]PHK99832.1 Na+:solute symporter [Neolewinella marina]